MKPLLTIMSGPQGAGNHLFSKVLGQNPNIWVWPELQEKYWEGHDVEPFADYWKNPTKLNEFDWSQSNHFVTSISCPYFDNGVESIPRYLEFVMFAREYADVQFLIVGRDQTILAHQQKRVRGKHTTGIFLEQVAKVMQHYNTIFASQELLYLYKLPYLQRIEKDLGLTPLELTQDDTKMLEILKLDANKKYIKKINTNWLDDVIKSASSAKGTL